MREIFPKSSSLRMKKKYQKSAVMLLLEEFATL